MSDNKSTHPVALAILIVIITAGVATALWAKYFRVLPENNTQVSLNTMGFGKPVTNKLDPKFIDANGDLIADAPTDPAQLIDPPAIRFAYIEEDDPAKQKKAWQPFMDYRIGLPVDR